MYTWSVGSLRFSDSLVGVCHAYASLVAFNERAACLTTDHPPPPDETKAAESQRFAPSWRGKGTQSTHLSPRAHHMSRRVPNRAAFVTSWVYASHRAWSRCGVAEISSGTGASGPAARKDMRNGGFSRRVPMKRPAPPPLHPSRQPFRPHGPGPSHDAGGRPPRVATRQP